MAELYFKDYREYIRLEFELRKTRRPSYSMRALARDLGVSPSGLNDFMQARVGMSIQRIEQIAAFFRWSEARKAHFHDLIRAKFDKDKGVRQASLLRIRYRLQEGSHGLSLDAFKAISEWYHLVILELCEINDHLDAATVAVELKLSRSTAKQAVHRLINLGLLKQTEQGLKPTEMISHFGDAGSCEAIRAFHSQILNLAQEVLQNEPVRENDSHSLVFSVDKNDVEKMNAEIRTSVLNIVTRFAQASRPDCIQALSLQIFPLWSADRGINK